MFTKVRKPASAVRRRVVTQDEEDDDDARQNKSVAAPRSDKTEKADKKPRPKPIAKSVLSFGNDDEEAEVFSVKRGVQGIAKKKKKGFGAAPNASVATISTSAWKQTTSGLYSAEGLAQLRQAQPNQMSLDAARKAAMISVSDDETEGAVFTGEDAMMVQLAEERGEALDGMRPGLQQGQASNGEQRASVEAEDFIAFDDNVPVPGSRSLSRVLGEAGRLQHMEVDEDGGEEQQAWEADQANRGGVVSQQQQSYGYGESMPSGPVVLISVADVKKALQTASDALKESAAKSERQALLLENELKTSSTAADSLKEGMETAGKLYEHFQRVRDHLSDFCGMLRAKAPMIDEVLIAKERIGSATLRRVKRRRREGQEDCVCQIRRTAPGSVEGLGAYVPLKGGPLELLQPPAVDTNRERRLADRARRVSQMRTRERAPESKPGFGLPGPLRDWEIKDAEVRAALESGGEESDGEREESASSLRALLEACDVVLEDVDPEVRSLREFKSLFETWKRDFGVQYARCYCSLSIPQLLAPLVKLEMMKWDPSTGTIIDFDAAEGMETAGGEDTIFERFEWFRCFFDFAMDIPTPTIAEYTPETDPDLDLVPKLLEVGALPILTSCISSAYNAMSVSQTDKFVTAVTEVLFFSPGQEAVAALLASPLPSLSSAVDDMLVPLVNPTIGGAAGLSVVRRQLWLCLKLLRNIVRWEGLLSSAVLVPIGISSLCSGRMAPTIARLARPGKPAPPTAALSDALAVMEKAVSLIPHAWREDPSFAAAGAGMAEAGALLVTAYEEKGAIANAWKSRAKTARAFFCP